MRSRRRVPADLLTSLSSASGVSLGKFSAEVVSRAVRTQISFLCLGRHNRLAQAPPTGKDPEIWLPLTHVLT